MVAWTDRLRLCRIAIAEHIKLRFDSGVDRKSHASGFLQHAFQTAADAVLEGFLAQPEVAGKPPAIAAPRYIHKRIGVGYGTHLIVRQVLRYAVQGGAGEALRTFEHLFQKGDRDNFGFRDAVQVYVAGDQIADVVLLDGVLQWGENGRVDGAGKDGLHRVPRLDSGARQAIE